MPDSELGRTIAKNLKRILYERRISPADLTRDLGIKQTTVSGWMNEYKVPRADAMDKLCSYLRVTRSELVSDSVQEGTTTKGVKIRIYGRVAAGVPLEMIDDIYDEEEIHPDMLKGGQEYFGLVIHGDSMEPRMKEGDIVIVRKQEDAETGDTVIVTVNGDDATCKKLKKYRDGIELIGTNPSFNLPIFASGCCRCTPHLTHICNSHKPHR